MRAIDELRRRSTATSNAGAFVLLAAIGCGGAAASPRPLATPTGTTPRPAPTDEAVPDQGTSGATFGAFVLAVRDRDQARDLDGRAACLVSSEPDHRFVGELAPGVRPVPPAPERGGSEMERYGGLVSRFGNVLVPRLPRNAWLLVALTRITLEGPISVGFVHDHTVAYFDALTGQPLPAPVGRLVLTADRDVTWSRFAAVLGEREDLVEVAIGVVLDEIVDVSRFATVMVEREECLVDADPGELSAPDAHALMQAIAAQHPAFARCLANTPTLTQGVARVRLAVGARGIDTACVLPGSDVPVAVDACLVEVLRQTPVHIAGRAVAELPIRLQATPTRVTAWCHP